MADQITPYERERLIELAGEIRNCIDLGTDHRQALDEFGMILPGTEILNLCHSDGAAETMVDVCLGTPAAEQRCTRDELLELVRKLLCTEPGQFDTEGGAVQAVVKFKKNCRHPAGSDLIFYPNEVFGHDNPTAEEIVDRALRGE
ncbi:MAG: bacteriocin immunity protein [Planctomycetales bacterium]|nr:bacteriocin immunity protein [Planctomycetales bacterium]